MLAGAVGLVLLAATSALPYVHFTAHGGGGDVTLYESYAQKLLDGQIPYHEFFFEYPPLSLVALVIPKATGLDYGLSLRLEMWVLLAVTLVAVLHTLRTLGADTMRVFGAAVLIGCSPALLGPIVFERFDAWPAALLSISLALLAAERWTSGSVGLALAICTKLYPVVVAPIALARVFAAAGRRVTTRAAIAGVIAGAIVTLPFAVVGFGGLGFSYYVQFKRPLQLESTGAALLLALDRLGLYDTTVQAGLSKDIAGSTAVGRRIRLAGRPARRDRPRRLVVLARAAHHRLDADGVGGGGGGIRRLRQGALTPVRDLDRAARAARRPQGLGARDGAHRRRCRPDGPLLPPPLQRHQAGHRLGLGPARPRRRARRAGSAAPRSTPQ